MPANGMFAVKVAVATGILIWAVIEDLRSRKFSNRSFMISCAVSLATALVLGGTSEIISLTLGFGAGVIFFLPLVLAGAIGAGDMKLMAAFGILVGWHAVLWTGVYGLVWGAVFGVIQIVVRGELRGLKENLTTLAITRSKGNLELHRIPFTAPLLLGWLSHLVSTGVF
jgi:Flp pilus assembly protein protease CpaA